PAFDAAARPGRGQRSVSDSPGAAAERAGVDRADAGSSARLVVPQPGGAGSRRVLPELPDDIRPAVLRRSRPGGGPASALVLPARMRLRWPALPLRRVRPGESLPSLRRGGAAAAEGQ